jgi:hypothetical protein
MSDRGLGDPNSWLDRASAEASMYQAADHASDQEKPKTSKVASKSASKDASVSASKADDSEDASVQTTTVEDKPPPPPARPREARVQFNHRILADRDRVLQKYKQRHDTTMQAIVDQMVDEYLGRRGLLPKGQD